MTSQPIAIFPCIVIAPLYDVVALKIAWFFDNMSLGGISAIPIFPKQKVGIFSFGFLIFAHINTVIHKK